MTWALRIDSTIVKALARAFRWRKLLETGVHTTIDDFAAAEKINPSYVSRVLRLTLLAPDIVEAILDGRQAAGMKLNLLFQLLLVKRDEQPRVVYQRWLPGAVSAIEEYGVKGTNS